MLAPCELESRALSSESCFLCEAVLLETREFKMICFGHAADTTNRGTPRKPSGVRRPRKDQTGREEGYRGQHVTHAAPPVYAGMGTCGPHRLPGDAPFVPFPWQLLTIAEREWRLSMLLSIQLHAKSMNDVRIKLKEEDVVIFRRILAFS